MAEQQPPRGASNLTNPDTFEGQWNHLRGQLRSWWDKLTEVDLEKIAGKKDALVGIVQERYGYARERAEQEVERRWQEYRDTLEGAGAYLQEKGMGQITGDLTALVRRYPVPSLLIGLGIGYLLGRTLGRERTAQGS